MPVLVLEHATVPGTAVGTSVLHRIAVGGTRAGALDYESLIAAASGSRSEAAVDLDDLLFLPHTTGTTGRPKGVMLTHANVTWNVINFLTSAEFRNDDVTIAVRPFFRVGGTGVNVLPVLFMGGHGRRAGRCRTRRNARPDRAPPGHRRLRRTRASSRVSARAHRWAKADLSSLRLRYHRRRPGAHRLVRRYPKRGVPLLQGYGLSEAGPLALLL